MNIHIYTVMLADSEHLHVCSIFTARRTYASTVL